MARLKDESKIELIYEVTLRRVLQQGIAGLRMADVAGDAGLAAGTLYVYFKSKEELISSLYLYLKRAKTDALLQLYVPDEGFVITFRKIWYGYFRRVLKHPEVMIFMEQYQRSSFMTANTRRESDRMLEPLENLLRQGIAEQIIKDIPVALLLSQLMGAIHEMVKLQLDNELKITQKVMDQCYTMAWDSVKR